MIEALKGEEVVDLIGGRFKLCALIQKRLVQLLDGERPLVERRGRSDLELVIEEIRLGKIGLADEKGDLLAPSEEALEAIQGREAGALPESSSA